MQQALVKHPTAEPVSLTEAKAHLRVDIDEEDLLISGLIRTARRYVEGYTRRALVLQSWKVTFPYFPRMIELPIVPARKVSSIQYTDSAGSIQTLSPAVYQVDLVTSDRARILPVYGEVWPSTLPGTFNAVAVNFVAGDAVPFSTDFSTDANVLNAVGHPLADGDVLQLWNQDGSLPAPLADLVNYYVVNATDDAFELALSDGGSPIDLTSNGTGTHFAGLIDGPLISATKLLVGHLFEHREDTVFANLNKIPMGVDSLLMPYTSIRF